MKSEKQTRKNIIANTFTSLLDAIRQTHDDLTARAGKAVNISLTMRNWLIGYYISEYEMNGADRASYGEALLSRLASELAGQQIPRSEERELRRYRRFYTCYPQIREALPPEFKSKVLLTSNSGVTDSRIVRTTVNESAVQGQTLISRLSFTHFGELITIDDATKWAGK